MDHSGRITTAGDKLSDFVKSKDGDFSKVDIGVSNSNTVLEKEKGSEGYGAAADATAATFEAVLGSIEKFESGDPTQIAMGVLDILAEVSAFAALTGPQGAIVAAVLGPLCTIISSLLGASTGEASESDEAMMKRVVTEALDVSQFEDLQARSDGIMSDLIDRTLVVKGCLSRADTMNPIEIAYFMQYSFSKAGREFIGELKSHIERDIESNDDKIADRTAKLITAYSSIVFVRCQFLYMLASLMGTRDDTESITIETVQLCERQKAAAKELLRPFLKRPTKSNYAVYSKVYSQPQSSFDMIQALCEERPEGKLMKIYNTKQKNYLQVEQHLGDDKDYRSWAAETYHKANFSAMPISTKFVVFRSDNGKIEIFSLAHAGYVYAAENNVVDGDRRRVYGWIGGSQFSEGYWASSVYDSSVGSVHLRSEYWKEYMYAADFNASEGKNPVYTWRPGNRVNQGQWIFEECDSPRNGQRIRSVSSGNCFLGISTNQLDIVKWRPNTTTYDACFDWVLIKLDNGTYNIKSSSSNMYLDGRQAQRHNVKLVHLTSDVARTNSSYMWHINKFMYAGSLKYAIQSVASKLYLDGGDDRHFEPLFNGSSNPEGDKYKMWDIDYPDPNLKVSVHESFADKILDVAH